MADPRQLMTRAGTRRDRFGLLLVVLISAFVLSAGNATWSRVSLAVLNLLALVVTVQSTRTVRGPTFRWGVIAVGVLATVLVSAWPSDTELGAVGAGLEAVIVAYMFLAVLATVARRDEVTAQAVMGAVSAYFLLGIFFAWVYMALVGFDPDAISPLADGEVPYYYSFVVLTTLGFGDVVPTSELAKRITVIQALVGQLFLATAMARLVSVWRRDPTRGQR